MKCVLIYLEYNESLLFGAIDKFYSNSFLLPFFLNFKATRYLCNIFIAVNFKRSFSLLVKILGSRKSSSQLDRIATERDSSLYVFD